MSRPQKTPSNKREAIAWLYKNVSAHMANVIGNIMSDDDMYKNGYDDGYAAAIDKLGKNDVVIMDIEAHIIKEIYKNISKIDGLPTREILKFFGLKIGPKILGRYLRRAGFSYAQRRVMGKNIWVWRSPNVR